ncbi:MAG: DUF1573 domain-containing protein [Thermoanaerobaculia bacterium]
MSDEWNTVNIRPGAGGVLREIDLLRRRYADHRSTLERLASDAPTEQLARRYRQLIGELEASMARIAELEMGRADDPSAEPLDDHDPRWHEPEEAVAFEEERPRRGLSTVLVVLAAAFIVGVLGLFAWNWIRGGAESDAPASIVEPSEREPVIEPDSVHQEVVLSASPDQQHYGELRRGTRAVRQFEIANNTNETLPISVLRSDCRCLWFEYADTIPPRGTTTLTVTVDGAKAPAGTLRETVQIVSKTDPPVTIAVEVVADIGG